MTQAERLGKVLKAIKPDVTADDRKAVVQSTELGYKPPTISKYLNGEVMNNDTAAKLIIFLKARIAKREKSIINL